MRQLPLSLMAGSVALVLCALAKRNPEGCRAWQLCASREVGRRICVVAGRQADMKKKLLVAPMLVLATFSCLAADLPDPALTPGAVNPHVTQANIGSTVCVKGWTKTVRPPAFYTNRLKKLQIRQYGYSDTDPRDYEEDHLVPLSVGGNPTDPRNLWPEPRNSEWNADRKSGVRARPSHPHWHRVARDWCAGAGVAYFFKQWGAWRPRDDLHGEPRDGLPVRGAKTGASAFLRVDGHWGNLDECSNGQAQALDRMGKKTAGRVLDGRLYDACPEVQHEFHDQ
jgi:Protein of unknown function (DUF5131)